MRCARRLFLPCIFTYTRIYVNIFLLLLHEGEARYSATANPMPRRHDASAHYGRGLFACVVFLCPSGVRLRGKFSNRKENDDEENQASCGSHGPVSGNWCNRLRPAGQPVNGQHRQPDPPKPPFPAHLLPCSAHAAPPSSVARSATHLSKSLV